ncbi:MAG: NUDIX hydrolase [Chloroflexi bacterium]|nr:NUDIX hydrolase [Chloroflexota bacterium]
MSEGVDALTETVLKSQQVFEGSRIKVRVDDVEMADGRKARREVVEHPDAVVILALRDDGLIAFVRQWRHATGRALLELPAGRVDPGEEPAETARRELREEVGLDPARLDFARGFFVAPGFANEFLHGFVARDCVESPLEADEDEELIVEWMPLGDAIELVESGEIIDAKSVIMIQFLALEAVGPLGRKIVRHYRGQQ